MDTIRHGEASTTGGQWNFSGVLYQLLATLASGLTAAVEEVETGLDTASVRIVVEPHKGGDTQLLQPSRRRVDQIKIRRGASPWTTRLIVETVLPDLFKAARNQPGPSQYRFVTDRLEGTAAFAGLLTSIRDLNAVSKSAADLDTLEQPFRWGSDRISPAQLFTRIAEALEASERELWEFLACVEVVGWSEAEITAEIDAFLTELVEEREEIPLKRKALCQHLLDLGKVGGSLSAEALLQAVDLNLSRLTHVRRLPALLREQVKQATRHARYDAARDVRAVPIMPDAPLAVLSGDSGQGKTWRLCRAALARAEDGRCALLLRAQGTLAEIEDKIVEQVWLTGFDRRLSLARVAERLRPKLADTKGIWLTVYLDDLADSGLAIELAQMPWSRHGITIVISAQNRITRMLGLAIEGLREIAVPDFTVSELRIYLGRSGRDPNLLPDDVLLSLLRPVLAAIYCRIPGSERWAAVSEYELMDRYWTWATGEYRTQTLHASDHFAVLALAGTLLGENPLYPWSPSVAHRCGLTELVRDRLITVGVLREDGQGGLRVSHDRVLNWAVAGEIERRFLESELTVQAMADLLGRLDKIASSRGDWSGRRLGYVLHDLLWKLTRKAKPEEVGALASLTMRSGLASRDHAYFFKDGLGSLGAPVIPVLSWMARQQYSQQEWLVPRHLATAFIAVAQGARPEVTAAAHALVMEDVEQSRNIGLSVLRELPAPQALNLLWTINMQRLVDREAAKTSGERWLDLQLAKEQSFGALSRAVRGEPDWVQAQALSVRNEADADQVIWLLLQLDVRIAKSIWMVAKTNLLARVSDTAISAARAIRWFRDRDELRRIEASIEKAEPFDAAVWFNALAYLSPEVALQHLERLAGGGLLGTSHWWLHGLLHRVGPSVHVRLIAVFTKSWGNELAARELARLYAGEADLLDSVTFDWLIDAYEARLAETETATCDRPSGERHLRSLVASATSPVLLKRLAARNGSRFEQRLTQKAIAQQGRSSRLLDRDGVEYHLILGAIGGQGYDELVVAELDRPNVHARTDGITASTWTNSPAIKVKLECIAESARDDTYEQVQLMDALAAHRADAGLRAMVQSGSPVFVRATQIRDDGPPWTGEDLSRVEQLLKSDRPDQRLQGINLCGFLGTETAGALLAPILEGDAASEEELSLARGVMFHLGFYRPTFLRRLVRHLQRDDRGISTANYLACYGDAEARAIVVKWLAEHTLRQLNSSELPIAFELLEHPDSAPGARAFLKRLWRSGLGFGNEGEILSALAEAGDDEASAALDAVAYQKPRRGAGSVVTAIRALGKTSLEEALAAAERFYRRTRAPTAAYLLLELDAEAGTKILLDEYADSPVPVRHETGRLLRRAAPRDFLMARLNQMSISDASDIRVTAAELAAWLPFEQPVAFLDRLVDDEAETVEKAALAALRQRQADAECAELIDSLPNQPKPRQWAWLHALIQRGDPAHLRNSKDPRSIHGLLDQIGDEFREEADGLLKRRAEDLVKGADKLEDDRCR